MRKEATIAENKPVFQKLSVRYPHLMNGPLTNTRRPFASSLQPSVMKLSYSTASFMYVDHILFAESSWTGSEGVVRDSTLCGEDSAISF